MAFAQLTFRESLRDIETCLSAQTSKLYHLGFRNPVRRSTLADANETHDWRIYAEFAQRLIAPARRLYAGDSLGVDLDNTVYALDSTTIDLCLSVFPWAHFRSTKAAVKMHTLLDLPAGLIEGADCRRRQRALVGEEHERLAGLEILEADAPQMLGVVPVCLDARKHDGLIADDTVCTVGGCGVEAPCVYVRLCASYEKGTSLM